MFVEPVSAPDQVRIHIHDGIIGSEVVECNGSTAKSRADRVLVWVNHHVRLIVGC